MDLLDLMDGYIISMDGILYLWIEKKLYLRMDIKLQLEILNPKN